jgi:hypothetical protein
VARRDPAHVSHREGFIGGWGCQEIAPVQVDKTGDILQAAITDGGGERARRDNDE